ncbi:MAG: hypothetical protein LBB72_04165 [Spirochaetaceae bacterium]|jgi:hypothetical protein|nr:hypothetical protein [Spirochaetaceae bacterium]
MKKVLVGIIAALIAMPAMAIDLGEGLSIGGGVKSGILVKNSDYTGKLGGLAHGDKYPMTLYFASQDNEAYKGEGWLNFGYDSENWGLNLSLWSHGNLKEYDDAVHLGDHFLWANFLDNRLRFIGGQGGGTPISSGGWLNADWLGYTGLRLFWVDPVGFSIGINFPDPDNGSNAQGIKPVTYLSTIMFGASYRYDNFWVSVVFDNNPIYDDSKANYDGGLHRDPEAEPIAQSGNIGFGIGVDNIFGGKGALVFDGMVTNLGEDDIMSTGTKAYKISPIKTALALKAAYPVTDPLYVELKAKYTMNQGDNENNTASVAWGKLEIGPYVSYTVIDNLKFELAVNYAFYLNSYYLALNVSPVAGSQILQAGQAAPYPWAFDYYSQWQLSVKPAIVYSFSGATFLMGYNGDFSRDHVQNTMYIDCRWSF